MTGLHAYAIGPIDWGWGLLCRLEEFAARLSDEEGYNDGEQELLERLTTAGQDIIKKLERAKDIARKVGWEGDFRTSVYVFTIPGDDIEMVYGFVWKQDNNGTTFVVSPRPLEHLRDRSEYLYEPA